MEREARLAEGHDALERGAWEEARAAFEAAVAAEETPEALEGLGLAAWWLDDAAATISSRERAYARYAAAGDRASAARLATWLAWDATGFRGETAVARGWIARGHRQLEGLEKTVEYGWLIAREGEIALAHGADSATGGALGRQAAALGRELGDVDLEMVGITLEGLALVGAGEVDEGMRLLDEGAAAATGGEMHDLTAIGIACCRLIFACDDVRDYDRAGQWADRLSEFCRRWGMRPLFAICRVSYGGVLLSRGEWRDAEAELTRAAAELEGSRPGHLAGAFARLGELRRRQGRTDEALRLFERVRGSAAADLGRARIALDRGNAAAAVEIAEAVLQRIPPGLRTHRAAALETVVAARTAAGVDAAEAAAELGEIAEAIGTEPLLASAAQAAGRLDEAVARFDRAGLPYEAANARLALAAELGDTPRARDERAAAERTLRDLGATSGGIVTPRELDVLRLVAEGLTDGQIAARLVLSEHTVHRHVANARRKLDAGSRAAAVREATRLGLL
jgi:DNA-binding CsgD family transcriptional regulator